MKPWENEPDKEQWVDPATDLDCLIVRSHAGALCGYVGLPPGHPLHGTSFMDIDCDFEVHGGLTYSALCDEDGKICHIPEPGRPAEVWWLGFDCAHAWDLVPAYEKHGPLAGSTYRDINYVRTECTSLAAQLKERSA